MRQRCLQACLCLGGWTRSENMASVFGYLRLEPNATPKPFDMNSYHNLDPSLFRHDAPNTPQNDMLQEYHRQAPQEITQNFNEFHRPPGAESMGTLSPHTQPGPGRLSLQDSLPPGHTELGGHASSRMLTQFSMDVQVDESKNVIYSSSPSRSVSLSPSHSHPSQASVHGLGNPSISQLPSYTSSGSSRSQPYSHLRALSQPSIKPTTVLGNGSGPPHYSGALQMAAPPSKLPSTMQPAPLPTPIGTNIPLLPLSSPPRRYSEADTQNAHNDHDLVTFYTDATQTVFPGFPPEPSSAQRFSPGFTDPMPGTSSQSHGGGSSRIDDTFPFSSSPISTDGSVGPVPSSASSSTITPGATALFHIPPHLPPLHSQATIIPTATPSSSSSSSSLDRPSERPRRVRSRRSEPPRDQRATDRLSGQRKSDDENTEALYKLFVPPGAEVKWKKDRLGIILHYATQLVERYNSLVEYYERSRDAREEQLAQSDEGLHQNQEQLFGRHGDFSREAGHWAATNDGLDRTLTNIEHGLHQQQRNSPMDDQHDIARP